MPESAARRMLLRTALSLPAPVLRAAAGGGVVYRGGRTLNPKVQFLWRAWRKPRPLAELTPEEARAARAELIRTTASRPPGRAKRETVTFEGRGGAIAARLHRPAEVDPEAAMVVWFHGGGGVVGSPEEDDAFCAELAEVACAPVLAPAYRKAPENRFPAGLDDAFAAWRWARENGARFGAAPGEAAVAGQCRGAGFAAAVALACARNGEPGPVVQMLVCPLLDVTLDSQSMQTYADAWPLSAEDVRRLTAHYLHPEDDPFDPMLSPFRAEPASGLAPAIVVTAGFDPLVDQGELYARKLQRAGAPVVYRCYDGLPHEFSLIAGVVPEAAVACREVAGLLREGLERRVETAADLGDRRPDEAKSLVI